MATVLAPTNLLRCSMWCSEAGQASVSSFYYLVVTVGGVPATDQDVGDTLATNAGALLRACINNNATFNGIVTQKIIPPPLTVDVFSTANAGAGSGGTPALPKQVTGLVSWYTALAGRAKRGRTYMPFPAVPADLGDGTPTAAYQTAVSTFANAVKGLTAIAIGGRTATLALILYHRQLTTYDVITALLVRNQWATQRRRGAYGRPNISPI
jgi:hypothetical protein